MEWTMYVHRKVNGIGQNTKRENEITLTITTHCSCCPAMLPAIR